MSSLPTLSEQYIPSGTAGTLRTALNGARIPGLDFLRALAVLLVLADHSGVPPVGPVLLTNGGLGVEIFFVLSGFLITWMLLAEIQTTGHIHLRDFYQRRVARLLPVFYAYVAIGIALLWATHKPIPWAAVLTSSAYVLNYYQAFTGAPSHFLSHCWSLAVEEQFYFLWPFLLTVLMRRGVKLLPTITWMIVAVWTYRTLATLVFGARDEYLYRALETRADDLLAGCLLAVLLSQPAWLDFFERAAQRVWLLPALTVLLFVSASMHDVALYKYAIGFAIEPIIIALLLPLVILRAQDQSGWTQVLTARPMILIGQASYGIYLFHPLILHTVRHGVEKVTGSFVLGFGVSVGVLTLVAYLSYTYFESPIRQRLRPQSRTH